MTLARRKRQPEIMDQPGLDPGRHRAALAGLARINAVSRSAVILWRELAGLGAPLRVLDLACGGGDVALGLARLARRAGVAIRIDGCDISTTAIAFARGRAADDNISFFELDVLRDPLPGGYDAVVCSLFLHHLSDDEAVELLRKMSAAAGRLVLVSDLARGRLGLLLAHLACRVLTLSDVVRTDGPISVRAAFTPAEAAELARRAGLAGATVERRWPCRFLLKWVKG